MEATSRDNLKLAVGSILLTCFALSLGDALIKRQSASFVIWQIFVIIGAVALLGLYLWNPDAETVALNPFLLGAWTTMWLDEWRIMGILAIAVLIGSVGAAYAYQNGSASTIASFDFCYVGFATIWGLILFDEIPGPLVSLGIILIVIAGAIAARGKSG